MTHSDTHPGERAPLTEREAKRLALESYPGRAELERRLATERESRPHLHSCNRPEGHPDVREGYCPTDHGGWVRAPLAEGVCRSCGGHGVGVVPRAFNGVGPCNACGGSGIARAVQNGHGSGGQADG